MKRMFCTIGSSGKTDLNWSTMVLRNTFIHLRANGLPDMLPAQMAILLPGWIKPKKNLVLTFKPSNPKHQQGTLRAAECRFFMVEKPADMRYNKLHNFSDVTGRSR